MRRAWHRLCLNQAGSVESSDKQTSGRDPYLLAKGREQKKQRGGFNLFEKYSTKWIISSSK